MLCSTQFEIKLSEYGLFYMTDEGESVSFPIG